MRIGLFSKLIASFIIILSLSFLLPTFKFSNTEALIASATFLYGVLYGFEISIVLGNFSQLKSFLATETGGLVSVYHLSQTIGEDFSKEVGDRIENYLKKAIDVPLSKHLSTNKEFFDIFTPLRTVKVEGNEKNSALDYINAGLYYIPQARSQISVVAPRVVGIPEWVMLITLGLILVAVILIGREPNVILKIASAVFATTVVGSLLLLNEIDNNRIQEDRLEKEVFNDTLEAIGRQRYNGGSSAQ